MNNYQRSQTLEHWIKEQLNPEITDSVKVVYVQSAHRDQHVLACQVVIKGNDIGKMFYASNAQMEQEPDKVFKEAKLYFQNLAK